ncbi:MAG: DNA helicase II [Gammaproteobacteria bacterium RIFCSPHIGHO2_12_FULL_41_15]|nr:MAG: DNA helicase II [Gammaproteobacteria bacterium RIFCSPHIGHO2_12_FULL_41_15]
MHAMSETPFLIQSLNDRQREAVSAPKSNLLILAGAGSGKTRVLVHRIAWLIEKLGVHPHQILAVTFTNKAAREMQARIEELHGSKMPAMWVGTFHGLAHRLLRQHTAEANLSDGFQIIDSDDQLRILKRLQKNLDLDEHRWPAKQTQWFINKQKEEGKRAKDITPSDYYEETMLRIYNAYEALCQRSSLVDFSELLLRSLELLTHNKDIAAHYNNRFQQILVDEFQDTNSIQYEWLKALSSPDSNLMVVGDDDQSIYSWRGAKIKNIQNFNRDFSDCKTIKLEQNYRSTENIVSAANAVISFNKKRLGKKLWTSGDQGDMITVYCAFREQDEAHYTVSKIQDWVEKGHRYGDVAILYRSNAQSRVLEEYLLDANIPYRIYGGQKFFERAEIKDALGYLRIMSNRQDDAAFERVVNTPSRGIGETSLNKIREHAKTMQTSLWNASLDMINKSLLTNRAHNSLKTFMALVDDLDQDTQNLPLAELTEQMLAASDLIHFYQRDKSQNGIARIENLEELITATKQFKLEDPPEQMTSTPLAAFLVHVALETGEGQAEAYADYVNLMTMHAAKGLEFPLVFITGMEEDLFPHKMSSNKPEGLEEERRLCYVAMTRAMKKLYLTYAESRSLHGTEEFHRPSRFIQEIPKELLEHVRPKTNVNQPSEAYHRPASQTLRGQKAAGTGLRVGQRVKHAKFGAGIILNYEGTDAQTRVEVQFENYGTKWLVANYAKLEPA